MTIPFFSYDFEAISAKDIIFFLKENGYETAPFSKMIEDLNIGQSFRVKGTRIAIHIPNIEASIRNNFDFHYAKTGRVMWDHGKWNYPNDEAYEKDKALYNKLKRKFQMEEGTVPRSIKDLDWIREQQKKVSGIRGFISRFTK